jgi:NadR type nicotinamide-nucleotide adenylyltransferase
MSSPLDPLVVTLIGTESTGKTTLAAELGRHFGAPVVAEAARIYLGRVGRGLTAEDVGPIAREQAAAEDAALAAADRLVVKDTDLVSTVVYARHYYGACPSWIEDAATRRRADLYLLHRPDVPWVPDGPYRDRPADRAVLHAAFAESLAALNARVVELRGIWAARRTAAIAAVQSALDRRGPS